jgi:hypothetical protein
VSTSWWLFHKNNYIKINTKKKKKNFLKNTKEFIVFSGQYDSGIGQKPIGNPFWADFGT